VFLKKVDPLGQTSRIYNHGGAKLVAEDAKRKLARGAGAFMGTPVLVNARGDLESRFTQNEKPGAASIIGVMRCGRSEEAFCSHRPFLDEGPKLGRPMAAVDHVHTQENGGGCGGGIALFVDQFFRAKLATVAQRPALQSGPGMGRLCCP